MTDDMKAKNLTLPHERPYFHPRFGPPRRPGGYGEPFDDNGPPEGDYEHPPPPPPPPPDDNFFKDDPGPPEPDEPPPF